MGMTGELSEEALAQISGASTTPRGSSASSTSRPLASTRGGSSSSSQTNPSSAGTTGRIGSNAQSTSGSKNNVSDTGAASLGYKSGMTVSLAAFMGTAAYLAL